MNIEFTSEEKIRARHMKNMERELTLVANLKSVEPHITRCLETWAGNRTYRYHGNKWRRQVRGVTYGMNLDYDVYLSPQDSLNSLLNLFEAVEEVITINRSNQYTGSVVFSADVGDATVAFTVWLKHSQSCKIVEETVMVEKVVRKTVCI
jgi:hypothetical protein